MPRNNTAGIALREDDADCDDGFGHGGESGFDVDGVCN